MQANENQDVNARPSGSEQGPTGGTTHLSAKLSEKLSKLAKWRIDPSSIEFTKDTREFHGGHATVTRAVLGLLPNPWAGTFTIRKDVAIKELKVEDKTGQQRVLGLALREADFLVGLDHKNIIKFEGFVEDLANDRIWLIFPWAERGNLKDFAATRDWEIPERISLINDVATGVEYLHGRSPPICHGDLKSVNILVNWNCRAIITDFGSARRLSKKSLAPETQKNQNENESSPGLVLETTICAATSTITLTGNKYTLRWAAPELLMDDNPGLWSDIWSLGWICYEVMTNSIPFEHVKKDSMIIKHVIRGDLPSVSDHARVALVQALHSLMTECWSIDPSKRPSAENCRNSMNQMPKIIPEGLRRTSDQAVSSDLSPRRLVALGAIHQMQNDYAKASSFLAKALTSATDTGDDEVKALALQSLAEMNMLRSEYSDAVSHYSQALKILADKEEKAKALLGLADALRLLEEYGEAASAYSEALEIYTKTVNSKGRANALLGLAEVHRAQPNRQERADVLFALARIRQAQQNYPEATSLYADSLTIYTEIGNNKGRANTLLELAYIHGAQENYTEAAPLLSESLAIYTEIGSISGTANALLGIQRVYWAQGDLQGVVDTQLALVDAYRTPVYRPRKADALFDLGMIHHARETYTEAASSYSEALKIYTEIANNKGRADALVRLADVHQARERYTEAASLYSESLEIYTDIGNSKGRAEALSGLAEVHLVRKMYTEAASSYSESLAICAEIAYSEGSAYALLGLAEVHRAREMYTEAASIYSEALAIYTAIADITGRANALLGLAKVYQARETYTEAASLYSQSLAIYTEIANAKGGADTELGFEAMFQPQVKLRKRADALLGLAEVYLAQGNAPRRADALLALAEVHRVRKAYTEAASSYSESLAIYTDIGNSKGRADALLGLAEVDKAQDNPQGRTEGML